MKYRSTLHLSLAIVAFGSLTACTVVPAQPVAYQASPVVVDTYPVYRSNVYYYDRYDRPDFRPPPRPIRRPLFAPLRPPPPPPPPPRRHERHDDRHRPGWR